MNWKLNSELRKRGLPATSVMQLGLANQSITDTQLAKRLVPEEPFVLVAWDNKMPKSHREALEHFGTTLAVIDKYADRGGLDEEQYYRDVIHRHADRMAAQQSGSRFKYSRARRRTRLA